LRYWNELKWFGRDVRYDRKRHGLILLEKDTTLLVAFGDFLDGFHEGFVE
jgi:hypothetical protein